MAGGALQVDALAAVRMAVPSRRVVVAILRVRGGGVFAGPRVTRELGERRGDALHRGPNPCVAPIERGPFYAVKVQPGCFGTFAGLRTDGQARVLNEQGQPIPGLYAAGTDMASALGGHYPSGGINLGPAMTFGYIAARHLAGVE